MTVVQPLMTSTALYPLLTALTAADGVAPMIPSEPVVLAAGVFAQGHVPRVLLIVLCVAVGLFIGDHLAYALSRSVVGPYLLGKSKRLARAVDIAAPQLRKRGTQLIVTSRFLPGGRTTMNAASGMTGLPMSQFTPACAIAALAWSTYTVGLGFLGGATFVAHPLLGMAAGLVLSFALGASIELIRKRRAPTGTERHTDQQQPATAVGTVERAVTSGYQVRPGFRS